jgi:hypothetical protein
MTSTSSTRDPERAKAHLIIAEDAIKMQVQQQKLKIVRLQAALVVKKDIIDDCQDLLKGPLHSIFTTGGGPTVGVSSSSESYSHPINELDLYKRVRDKRRKRIMERLVPIVGDTVARSFHNNETEKEPPTLETSDSTSPIMETWDCTTGWITTYSRTTLWLGTRCKNKSSKMSIRDLSHSIDLQDTNGAIIPRLLPQESCAIISLVHVDSTTLQDNEYLDREKAAKRILSESVHVHYYTAAEQMGDKEENTQGQVVPTVVSIPNFLYEKEIPGRWMQDLGKKSKVMTVFFFFLSNVEYTKSNRFAFSLFSTLVNVVHPAQYTCRLEGSSRDSIGELLEEEFKLSHGEGVDMFGSLEEELIVTIDESKESKGDGGQESLIVEFSAPTQALVLAAARKLRLLSPHYKQRRYY